MAENDEKRVDLRGHRRGGYGIGAADRSLIRWAVVAGRATYRRRSVVARVAGIALIALGIACWLGPPLVGMLSYSVLATLYLACLGFVGSLRGGLLWCAPHT